MQNADPKVNQLQQRFDPLEGFVLTKALHYVPILDSCKQSRMWHPDTWTEIRSNCQMPVMLVKSGFILGICYFEPRARALNWLKLWNIHHCSFQFSIALNNQKLHINSIQINFICCTTYEQTPGIKILMSECNILMSECNIPKCFPHQMGETYPLKILSIKNLNFH